jgi:hypothetical protein
MDRRRPQEACMSTINYHDYYIYHTICDHSTSQLQLDTYLSPTLPQRSRYTAGLQPLTFRITAIPFHSSSGRSFRSRTLSSGFEFRSHDLCIGSSNSSFSIASTTPSSQASILFPYIDLWTVRFGPVSDTGVSTGVRVGIFGRGLVRPGWRKGAYRFALNIR